MKKLLLLTTLITFVLGVTAQNTIFEDDFESYTVGDGVATQTDDWETWSGGSGGAEDAIISDDYANSGSKSMLVTGDNDMVNLLGQETSGVYNINFWYYMESGYGGYYNFQHTFGSEWAFAVFFNDDGTGYLEVGGQQYDLTYPQDQWFKIENYIDLDADEATLVVNGEEIHTWQYSLLEGEDNTVDNPMLDVVNFYAAAEDPADPKYYVDDFNYLEGDLVFGDGFEPPYEVGTGVAEQSDEWTTWSDDPGSSEDALVSDDYAHNGTQSMLVTDANDMVYDLGGETSGVYDVNFWFYMESGFGGYYNLEHEFGSTWAMEVYFSDDGTGYLSADGQEIDLTYPQDEWFYIENHVDLDEDMATMYINGEEVHSWEYSQEPDGTDVDNPKLDVVNFYSAAEDPADPKYYVDDFEYWIASTGLLPPSVGVSPLSISTDGQEAEFFTVENNGEQTLEFETYPVYPMDGNKKAASKEEETTQRVQLNHKGHNKPEVSQAEAENGISFNPESRDGTLTHVQSDLASGVGYSSETEVRVGAKFRPEDVSDYIGMMIDKVIIYHMDPPMDNASTMKIWDRGEFTTPGPGELLYESDYTANEDTQEEISVDEDIYITGKDLWAGYETTDPGEGIYPLGSDDGPQIDGVNWSSTGPGWSQLTIESNWGVIVELVGDGIPTWMSVSPQSGSIEPGNSEEIMIDFTTEGLEPGIYEGEVHVGSNDPDNQYTVVSVTLDVATGIDDQEKVGVMTYPNPATDYFNVKANERINNVKVLNNVGQVVHSAKVGTDSFRVNTSNLEKGVYLIQVETESNQVMTNKIVVK
ncbi:MAG: T9SS type A sorting domain-containing protein [Bacteroidales bacterium]|nr:T9SS type A sorting domain-containing protein [Bacteroidales bacterium]MCF8334650.1 T9SS type A sorting domain-containing protein [Bacteroidales bacterium]